MSFFLDAQQTTLSCFIVQATIGRGLVCRHSNTCRIALLYSYIALFSSAIPRQLTIDANMDARETTYTGEKEMLARNVKMPHPQRMWLKFKSILKKNKEEEEEVFLSALFIPLNIQVTIRSTSTDSD